jgi:hypothetical protein
MLVNLKMGFFLVYTEVNFRGASKVKLTRAPYGSNGTMQPVYPRRVDCPVTGPIVLSSVACGSSGNVRLVLCVWSLLAGS